MVVAAGCGSTNQVESPDAALTTTAVEPSVESSGDAAATTEVESAVESSAAGASTTDAAAPEGDRLPVIVDTDVSLDDVMAILYLLRRPDVDILAIAVDGNGLVHCDAGVEIVTGLLALGERAAVPVACGADRPLEGDNSFPAPWREARDAMATAGVLPPGDDPSADSAADVIFAAATASSAPPTVVLLGTHTNLAQAVRDHPDLAGLLGAIHIMGGAVDVPGNTLDNPDAEWNLWVDPVAVAEVFAIDVPIGIVPLDATSMVPLTEAFIEALASNAVTPEAEAALAFVRADPTAVAGELFQWDQLAVVALVEPGVVTWADLDVDIDRSAEPQLGGALTAGGGRPALVAVAADRAKFESEYLSTLTGRDVAPSGDPEVSAARGEYIDDADRLCAVADADADAVYASVLEDRAPDGEPSAELFGELWEGLEPILRHNVGSLRGIPPPADDAATLEAFYDDFEAAIDELSATVDAAVAGDDEALATLAGQSSDADPFADVDRRAREFGFRVCGAR